MTQPATERETRPQPKSSGKGLTKKIGPLPAWGWAAIAGGGALVWYIWRKKKNAASSTASAASSGGACTDANGMPGTLDSAGNCVPAAVIYQGGSAGAAPGTLCKDSSGNPGFVNAAGDCDTSLAGTGTPGGGQDAALLAQIKSLQGQESREQKTIADIQSDVGEPAPPRPVIPPIPPRRTPPPRPPGFNPGGPIIRPAR